MSSNKPVKCRCGAWLHQKHDCTNPGPKGSPEIQGSTTTGVVSVSASQRAVHAFLTERRDLVMVAAARPGIWSKLIADGPASLAEVTPAEAAAFLRATSARAEGDFLSPIELANVQTFVAKVEGKLVIEGASHSAVFGPAPEPAETDPGPETREEPSRVVTFAHAAAADAFELPSLREAVAFCRGFEIGAAYAHGWKNPSTRAFPIDIEAALVEMKAALPEAECVRALIAAGAEDEAAVDIYRAIPTQGVSASPPPEPPPPDVVTPPVLPNLTA